jgi:uncharacterized protein YoxC
MEPLSMFLQVIIVVATIALLAIAVAIVRALGRFAKAADYLSEPTGAVAKFVENASRTSTETRELVARLDTVAEKFSDLSDRVFKLSSAALDEVEPPVRQAVAVARGIRAGAELLMDRWGSHEASHTETGGNENGGNHHG